MLFQPLQTQAASELFSVAMTKDVLFREPKNLSVPLKNAPSENALGTRSSSSAEDEGPAAVDTPSPGFFTPLFRGIRKLSILGLKMFMPG